MLDLLIYIITSACLAAFCVGFFYKVGFIEFLQTKGGRLIAELANCQYCISFWANVAVAIGLVIYTQNICLIVIPLFSTQITRKLIS